MFVRPLRGIAISCFAAGMALMALPAGAAQPHKTLPAFQSDAAIRAYLQRMERKRTPPPPPAPPAAKSEDGVQTVVVTGSIATSNAPITNNQTVGVDEGDIVKRHGDALVVLHRGRLFTISLAKGGLRKVSQIDAYPPGVDASEDWYDEMLISGDRVVVIGYSYGRGGTQINLFQIDADGHLAFEDAYQLRSNDYYSSRNYASRLIGTKLIFYTPRYLGYGDFLDAFPALRHWRGKGAAGPDDGFVRISNAQRVYYSRQLYDLEVDTIHSVTVCDLATRTIRCRATSVLGPDGRVFYVSGQAVYVWVTPNWGGGKSGLLYRMPLDGSAPSAIAVHGGPVDQFSFREDGDVLNVLIRSEGKGDAMWAGERSSGQVGLVRIPLGAFGDGTDQVAARSYRRLPTPDDGDFQNRFVGNFVLYGTGNGWVARDSAANKIYATRLVSGETTTIPVGHPVDRIDLMGGDAVVVGSDEKNLHITAIDLRGTPRLADAYMMQQAAESESRSHAFFFRTDPDTDGRYSGRNGIMGLPVAHPATPSVAQLFDNSAGVLYVRRSRGRFVELGELASHPETAKEDACVASCVDWYGNARPIFIGDRAFALMGYELVEGRLGQDRIVEQARLSYAPAGRPTN